MQLRVGATAGGPHSPPSRQTSPSDSQSAAVPHSAPPLVVPVVPGPVPVPLAPTPPPVEDAPPVRPPTELAPPELPPIVAPVEEEVWEVLKQPDAQDRPSSTIKPTPISLS